MKDAPNKLLAFGGGMDVETFFSFFPTCRDNCTILTLIITKFDVHV